jgi:asparagine synthase (glutamine-hydrolysing)
MSGLAGMLRFRGVADPAAVARMTATLSERGPDGEGSWVDGPAGLGHRLLQTTPESLGEKQPVCDDRTGCRLVWDGRLDNRDELISSLGGAAGHRRDRPDPELVLDAYARWGDSAFPRLVGDFALALWDAGERRLICARDALGAKPLYYHVDSDRIVVASAVRAVLADPAVRRRPDDAMIADFLLMDFRDHGATFFADVRQLPPGHILSVGEEGTVRLRRFWAADPARETRYPRDSDYLEHFRATLRDAVRCRLRSHAPIGVLLSGGIDSTAVTAVAESIRRAEPGHPSLQAVTLLWDEFLAEEREAIDGLTAGYGTPVQMVAPAAEGRRLTRFELDLAHSEAVHHESFVTVPLLTRPLADRGARALLTGFGADELLVSAEEGHLVDLARSLRLTAFRRELRRMAHACAVDPSRSALGLAWFHAPSRLKRAVKGAMGRRVPRWLSPTFARRAGLAARPPLAPRRTFPTSCQESSYRAVTSPAFALALTWMDATASAAGLECRHPFLDRRLVELFLSVPGEVKVRQGYRKMFLQAAVAPVSASPPRPVERPERAVAPLAHAEWAPRDAERLREILFRPGARLFEYVDRAEAARIRDRYLAGEERWRNLLWQFAKLELWLREFAA